MEAKNLNSLKNLMGMRDLIQDVGNPLVEAFPAGLGFRGNSSMDTGWNAQGQFAGIQEVSLHNIEKNWIPDKDIRE